METAPDPNDGRKALISATPRGREVAGSVIARRERWLTEALNEVATPEERELLARTIPVLNRLADSRSPTVAPELCPAP